MAIPLHLLRALRPILDRRNDLSRRRRRALYLTAAALALGAVLLWARPGFGWSLALLAGLGLGGWALWRWSRADRVRPEAVVREIEVAHPDLQALLVTAAEQGGEELHFLQRRVVDEAADEVARRRWGETLGRGQLGWARLWQAAALVVCAALAGLLLVRNAPSFAGGGSEPEAAPAAALPEEAVYEVEVVPGDAEVERGSRVLVTARFPRALPAAADLLVVAGAATTRVAMARNLSDPVFGAAIERVSEDAEYRVAWAEGASGAFRLSVYDLPRMVRADARVTPPATTRLPERTVEDTTRVQVFEGSELAFTFRLNKPVARAVLRTEDGAEIEAVPEDALAAAVWRPEVDAVYRLRLVDAEGRENRRPPKVVVKVLRNQPPKVAIQFPKRDVEANPIEEIWTEARVWDDGGVTAAGITVTHGGEESVVPLDVAGAGADEKTLLRHMVDLEALEAEPNQLVTWYYWAEDVDATGATRRSESDMFFAEVRFFEEIFQEQPPQSGAGEPSEEAQQQMRLQEELLTGMKEIVNATWKVRRRGGTPESDAEDTAAISASQEGVLEKSRTLAGMVTDAEMSASLQAAMEDMEAVVEHLGEHALPDALAREQSAYDHLLELRARLIQVMQASQSQSRSQSPSQSQRRMQQMQNMEMREREQRYETERLAEEQQREQRDEEQRENLQILNRLKELAQRQDAVSEQIKELEAALEAAETEAEKEELRRRLKRLTEEQRDMLADFDELDGRMESEPNRERTAEAREELDAAREQAQAAAEQLERGETSQAANTTSRAQETLEELAEDFRAQTANRFNEALRELRQETRELADRQEELAGQLAERERTNAGRIEDSLANTQLSREFGEQEERLEEVVDALQALSEDAANESLLSRRTYEAVREVETRGVRESLEEAAQNTRWSRFEQAGEAERQAREGIEQLRENVEAAAESVLGDEAEALRMAGNELRRLIEDVEQEAAREGGATPSEEAGGTPSPASKGEFQEPGGGQPQPGGTPSPASEGESQEPGGGQPQSGGTPSAASEGESQEPGGGQPQSGGTPSAASEGESQEPGGGQPQSGGTPSPASEGEAQEPGGGQPQSGGTPSPASEGEGQEPGEGQPQSGGTPSPASEGEAQEPGEGQPQSGGTPSPASEGEGQGGNRQPGEPNQPPGQPGQSRGSFLEAWSAHGGGGGPAPEAAPFTGADYGDWSDRLRDVEELLGDPELRREANRIRGRARELKREALRHSEAPRWDLVESRVTEPLRTLRKKVDEELARRGEDNRLVPLDRDPVPARYEDLVRRYYERLGSGE